MDEAGPDEGMVRLALCSLFLLPPAAEAEADPAEAAEDEGVGRPPSSRCCIETALFRAAWEAENAR